MNVLQHEDTMRDLEIALTLTDNKILIGDVSKKALKAFETKTSFYAKDNFIIIPCQANSLGVTKFSLYTHFGKNCLRKEDNFVKVRTSFKGINFVLKNFNETVCYDLGLIQGNFYVNFTNLQDIKFLWFHSPI